MQVSVPIPEVGDTIRPLACYKRQVVALEAQGELLRSEFARMSLGGVGGEEQFGLWGGMGSVAICALAVRDSRMLYLVVLSENLVAFPAQPWLVAQEQGTVIRCVGSVAVGAAAVRDRLVDHGTAIDHAIVALLTQSFCRPGQKLGVIGRMGIVAGQAAVLIDDTVKFAFHEIIVAFGTQIGSGFEEEGPVFR